MKEGLLVTEINHINKNDVIISREIKNYNNSNVKEYINYFNNFKNEGRLENLSFYDGIWILYNYDGIKNRRLLNFEFQHDKKISILLKTYVINLMRNKLGINEIAKRLKYCSEAIYCSNFFNFDMIEEFEGFINDIQISQRDSVKNIILEFIKYCNFNCPKSYIDFLLNINIKNKKVTRRIPNYKSVLYFDYIINDFIEKDNFSEVFIPIILWWKITSKIPMRSIELLRLKKSDFFKEDDKFYIRITRRKPNNFILRHLERSKIQKFRITEELYNLIINYMNDKNHQSEYFLCKNHYNFYIKNLNSSKKILINSNDRFSNKQLNGLLEYFYSEIAEKKYHLSFLKDYNEEKLQMMKLGDTRHLAIINLVLQGTNHFIIKEMCGHKDIKSHLHYLRHTREYITSKILVLSDIMKFESQVVGKLNDKFDISNRRNKKAQQLNVSNYMKIGDFFCKAYIGNEAAFPNLCIDFCENCNYGVKDINYVNVYELDNEIIKIKSDIEKCLDIIELYLTEIDSKSIFDIKNKKMLFYSQENMEKACNAVEKLTIKAAKVESYKFKKMMIKQEEN